MEKCKIHNITNIFIATDGTPEEIDKIKNLMKPMNILNYKPNENILRQIKDGGVAIVDQIICSKGILIDFMPCFKFDWFLS